MSDIDLDDPELLALMAELEEQNAQIEADAAPKMVATAGDDEISEEDLAALEPEVEPEPEPEPEVEPEPVVVSEPLPKTAAKPKFRYEQPNKAASSPAPVVAAEPEPEIEIVVEPEPEIEVIEAVPEPEPEVVPEPIVQPKAEPKRPTATTSASAALKYNIDVAQFQRDTLVTEASLDNCMIEQSGLRAYYGAQAAQAEAQASRLKARFDVLEAKLYDKHRKLLGSMVEKTTEKMVENAVKQDPSWLNGKNAVIESESIAAVNKSLVDAMRDRKDMLVQLGADRREEGKGQMRMMAQKQSDDDQKSRAFESAKRALAR